MIPVMKYGNKKFNDHTKFLEKLGDLKKKEEIIS